MIGAIGVNFVRAAASVPKAPVVAAVATVATLGLILSHPPAEMIRREELKEFKRLSNNHAEYMKFALKLHLKGRDSEFKEEYQKNIGLALLEACASGDSYKISQIADHNYVKIDFPVIKVDRNVEQLLDRKLKILSIEDFEWALQQKDFALYETLLKFLCTENKSMEGLLPKGVWFWCGKVQGRELGPLTYESLLDHPRLQPYQELARSYHDRHEAGLLERCQKEIETPLNDERGEIDPDDAREHLAVLEKLLETKDFVSLHWLYVNEHYWKPPAAGTSIMN